MATANTSLEKTLALGTAGNEILSNPERVGNGLKTLALRLRGSKVELEEAGEEVDEFVTSTSKMQGLIKSVTGVDIMRSADEYKDVYEILDEIAVVYGSLTDVNRASLTEALFGKNQANLGTAILTNFKTARNVLKDLTSGKALGSATKEYEKWQKSLEAKTAKLGSTFERMSIAVFDEDTLGSAIDGLTQILSIISGIAEVMGGFPTVAGAAGALLSGFMPDLSVVSYDSQNKKFDWITTLFPRMREEMQKTLDADEKLMKRYISLKGSGEELTKKQADLTSRMSEAARIAVGSPGFDNAALDTFVKTQKQAIDGTKLHIKLWNGLKSAAASALSIGTTALAGMAIGLAVEGAIKAYQNWKYATELRLNKAKSFLKV